jgi:hypothetical protein
MLGYPSGTTQYASSQAGVTDQRHGRGWYIDTRRPDTMLFWTGTEWKDGEKALPDREGWWAHFLLFVVVAAVFYLAVLFLIGLLLLPFALRASGRRARDLLMVLIPLWGTIVVVQTMWRLSARRICWLPRHDLASKPLFGPAILPVDLVPQGSFS